jgi:hypothetical protein
MWFESLSVFCGWGCGACARGGIEVAATGAALICPWDSGSGKKTTGKTILRMVKVNWQMSVRELKKCLENLRTFDISLHPSNLSKKEESEAARFLTEIIMNVLGIKEMKP